MSDTTPSNRVRDILHTAAADLTPDVVYAAIQVAERRRDRADADIQLLNAKFVEVARAVHVAVAKSHRSELQRCQSGKDGDCIWDKCPQNRDGEPAATGRSCPLYDWEEEGR
jgi:hypothetical protein